MSWDNLNEAMDAGSSAPQAWTIEDVERYLAQPIAPVRTPVLYQAGLVMVACALILLQAIYAAMVLLAGYGTWLYLLALPRILSTLGMNQVSLIVAISPLVAGALATFFLLKPFLARPARLPDSYRITRSDQPVLFAFVDRLCDRVGSPRPSAIELDLQVNASARLSGWLSLFRSDLRLTIGIPLAAGLTLPQFSGILAHEFGHFSQHAGMRLYFLIERVRHWFHRVARERDKWDEWLDRMRAESRWGAKVVLSLAYGCVFLSRRILRGLQFCAQAVSSWFSRQMEFNADRHQAELVGERTMEDTLGRVTVLGAESRGVWATMERALQTRRLCDNFAVALQACDRMLAPEVRTNIVKSAFEAGSERWASHPRHRDRLDAVHGVRGILADSEAAPAEAIFRDFDELCRAVTRHHYDVKLGKTVAVMTLVPAAEFASDAGRSERRAQAVRNLFGALKQPARYFRLAPPGPAPAKVEVNVCMSDQSAEYWRVLEESLLRNSAAMFMKSGGRVNPAAFRVSSGEYNTVCAEAADSRRRLQGEIERLRESCSGQAHILGQPDPAFADAYRVLSGEQESLLNLRHEFQGFNVLRLNLKHLNAARAANAMEDRSRDLVKTCKAILAGLDKCASPLTPGRSLADEMLLGGRADSMDANQLATLLLNRSDVAGAELLGELCDIISRRCAAAAQA